MGDSGKVHDEGKERVRQDGGGNDRAVSGKSLARGKTVYCRIRPDGNAMPWCTVPSNCVPDYLNESEPGQKWEIEVLDITDEQFKQLPEFEGW